MNLVRVVFFICLMIPFFGCNNQQKESTVGVQNIPIENLMKLGNLVQLIDVRTPDEYSEGYILEAKNINFFDEDFLNQLSVLEKDEPVYVYCKKGGRSSKASIVLKEEGFSKVYNLEGGIMRWTEKGNKLNYND